MLQSYGTADLGLVAYESPAMEGMILDESVIVEIVRPGTGEPVDEGEVGEVVVTSLNPTYPLIRFATGDLSAILPGQSPCGRTNTRIKGWMGRADQTTKVKGMSREPRRLPPPHSTVLPRCGPASLSIPFACNRLVSNLRHDWTRRRVRVLTLPPRPGGALKNLAQGAHPTVAPWRH